MPFYMTQWTYKDRQIEALVDNPHDRYDVVKKLFADFGGKLHHFFMAFGEYDVVAIVELPGNEAAVAMGLASVAGGALSKYNTTVLLSPEEASGAMKKAKKVPYTAPK